MAPKETKEFRGLDDECRQLLRMAMTELSLSAGAYDRILKVSRTVADLERSEPTQAQHISKPVQVRATDRQLWIQSGRPNARGQVSVIGGGTTMATS